MGTKATTSLWDAPEANHFRTSPDTTQTGRTIQNRSWRFRVCDQSYPYPKRWKREKTSDCLFLCHPNWCRTQLWHLQTGVLCNCQGLTTLEAIHSRIPPQDLNLYQLSRCPAHSTYLRLTHKLWASCGHALRLSDWRLVSGMTVWEPRSNLGAGITVQLLYADLLVASQGLSDQSA